MKCPYCGNNEESRFTVPVSLCLGVPDDLGIKVPQIQKCRKCNATLSPKSFLLGTAEYVEACARIAC